MTIASSGSACSTIAFEILEHLALVLVDVAALPVPVGPFGEQGREPGQAQVVTEPGGGCGIGQQVQAERPGLGPLRDRRGARRGRAPARRPRSPPTGPSLRSRAATARARSPPAGCPRSPASPGGSRAPCSGGRRPGAPAFLAGRSPPSAWPRARSAARRSDPASSRSAGPTPRGGRCLARSSRAPRRRSRPGASNGSPPGSSPVSSTCALVAATKLGLGELRRLASLLFHHDSLGEVNQPVAPGPFLGEQGQLLDQPAAPAGEANRQRTQPHLDREPAARERDRPCALLEPHGHHPKTFQGIRSCPVAIRLRPMPSGKSLSSCKSPAPDVHGPFTARCPLLNPPGPHRREAVPGKKGE